jgi:plasmid stabilization system protein ParE
LAVTWRVKAIEDVGKIVRYIARDNPVAARQMGKDLLWAGDSLELFRIEAGLAACQGRGNW